MSDDPEPTDTGHFEIYTFNNGTNTRSGTAGESGIENADKTDRYSWYASVLFTF